MGLKKFKIFNISEVIYLSPKEDVKVHFFSTYSVCIFAMGVFRFFAVKSQEH